MLPIRLITFVMTTLITERSFSTPVYNLQPAQITANIGTMGRNIRHLPCVSLRTGTQGTCMFAIDCLKANGTHLGTCIDRFYFGSCCHLPDKQTPPPIDTIAGILDNTIDENDALIKPPKYPLPDNSISIPTPSTTIKFTTKIPTSTSNLPPTTYNTIKTNKNNTTATATEVTATTINNSVTNTIANLNKIITNNKTTESNIDKPFTLPLLQQLTTTTTMQPEKTTEKFVTSQSVETTTTKLNRYSTTTHRLPIITTTRRIPIKTTIKPLNNTKLQSDKINLSSIENEVVKKPINATKNPQTTTEIPYKLTTFQTINNQTTKPKPVRPIIRPITTTTTTTIINTPKPKPRPTTTRKPITKPTYITKPVKITRPTTVPSVNKRNITTAITTTKRPTKPTKITTKIKPQTTTELPSKLTTILSPIITTTTIKITTSTIKSDNLTTVHVPSILVPVQTIKPDQKIDNVTTVPTPTPSQHENEIITVEDEKYSSTQHPPGLVTWTSITEKLSTTSSTESTTMGITNTSSNVIEPDDWTPITPPDGWVLLPSVSPITETPKPSQTLENSSTTSTHLTETTVQNMTKLPDTTPPTMILTSSTKPFSPNIAFPTPPTSLKPPVVLPTESTTVSNVQINETLVNLTTTKAPTLAEKINASITNMIFSSTQATNENEDFTMRPELNMSDYRQVCGRRMYPQARIVGGKNSTFGRWPWQISLRQWRTSTYLHKCGAALLNENWAITAAHCVDSVPPSDLLLRLGEHDLTSESEPYGFQERRVQIVASHPQFDPRTFEYDLALLRFYEPVTFQPNIIPVCVPNSDEGYVGKTAHVTGWGRLHEDGPLPNTLQEVSVPVINNSVCEQMYRSAGYIEHIPNIFICAGLRIGGSDSCEGDSGGPMVIQRSQDKRFILAGVISWGIGCAEPNQPGVYTRISEFRHWINQILQF